MEKSWVMLMYQTDKEHKENEDGGFTGEVQHAEKSGLSSWDWSALMVENWRTVTSVDDRVQAKCDTLH